MLSLHVAPERFKNAEILSIDTADLQFRSAWGEQTPPRPIRTLRDAPIDVSVHGGGCRRNLWLGSCLALICWLGVLGGIGIAHAGPTRYVTDEFKITLRSGAGKQYRILDLLPTGTSVEVLSTENGWTQVSTGNGRQGWVPSQYLIGHPPAADRLQQVSTELAKMHAQDNQTRQQLETSQQQLAQARNDIQQLSSQRGKLTQQLDEARDGLELATENKQLKKQVIDLRRRLQDLANETERLSDRSRQDWFLVGAGVLFAGMLVGIIMTRIRWRRRSSWGDL